MSSLPLAYQLYKADEKATERKPRQWMSIAPRMARLIDHDIYALDMRNHGQSPHIYPHRYQEMVDDIEAFVRALGVDRVSLMGHSMGGKVSMTTALMNPGLVDRLVVEDNVPCRVKLMHDYGYYIEGMRKISDRTCQFVEDAGMRRFVLSNLTKQRGDMEYKWEISLDNLLEGYQYMGGWDVPANADGISAHPAIDQQFPENKVVLLETGHNVAWERPREFLDAVPSQQLPLCRRAFSASTQPRQKAEEAKAKVVSASALVKDQELHGFLKLKAIRLRHTRTGAEWLHIDRDDSNNVFSIGFNTSPSDSTGVPHILEHTTLCGSERYPVRDPFFKMLNRSMSTFMNAWTAHDYTQYPFSTQNAKDYENLQNVYLDSLDFRQEGWRLERSDPSDSTSAYQMKGRAEQQLYPDTTYQYVSGGDPAYIPDLTHEQLVHFHHTRYHPSNARIYSLWPRHERLQPGSKTVTEFGPIESVGSPDKQTKFSVSYLTNDLRDALIDSQIGSDYSSNTGYSPFTRQTSLSVGLQGLADKDIPLVEQRIGETFAKRVDAALAGIELAYKHKTANFGMSLMKSLSTGWFHGVDPVDYLKVSDNIARMRADVEQGKFFENIVDKYFANSKHKLKYIMLADAKYNQQLEESEQRMIQDKLAKLTNTDLQVIDEKNRALAKEQMRKEDLSSLPTLTMADVNEKAERYALDMSAAGGSATNGISYLRIINDVRDKYPELRPYLPLFCDALTYLGTKSRSMSDIETDIRLHTGGVSFSPFVSTDLGNLGHIEAGIFIRLTLPGPAHRAHTDFDNTERLRTLLTALSSSMFNDVASSGHAFARRLAGSTLTPEMNVLEAINGISQVKFLSDLSRLADLSPVVEKLKQVQQVVFNKLTMRAAITTNKGSVDENQAMLDRFIDTYPQLSTDEASHSVGFQAIRTVPYSHPDSVKLQLLAKFLTPNYLHREIRERNGAYGGGASYSALQGIFGFFSYRDPSPLETVETFANIQISDREMSEAKLSVFGDLDNPISGERRDQFFAVTANDLKDAAQFSSLAVIGEESLAIPHDWEHLKLQ
ncbi:hypothetical protein DL89DRAFT_295151 [Linderina pennispora]|uniref:Peptidase M16C associated domain-containing protein n=1 Tax=Linderina pennispora TaxID=61395 RepID=A0A1Y1VZU4_9FUNG|nr:uncharacterized protein DL89DRAFT_295151 [Linderina pennispora]ORX66773.1 hypothetical protein DL89DRAFT_295151 [Linderina pennispora]